MARTGNSATVDSAVSTQASSVYDRLQQDILTGQIKPGRKLRLKELTEEYGAGNSPLREALNRLSANGMVVREENRGFRVSPASAEELLELSRTRCWLEEVALRQSIANGDAAWEERIVLAFHWLSQAAKSNCDADRMTSVEWESHHENFHMALISACNASILMDFCVQLQKRTIRYRNLVEVVDYREGHELEEHRELQNAVLNRDADLAIDLLERHCRITVEILLASGRFD